MFYFFRVPYLLPGDTAQARQKACEKYLLETTPDYELKLKREALQRGN